MPDYHPDNGNGKGNAQGQDKSDKASNSESTNETLSTSDTAESQTLDEALTDVIATDTEATEDITTDLVKENPIRYAGYYWDRKTQYYYLQARYYDPRPARFISEDTYEGEIDSPQSLNLYVYAINNPENHVDPTGHNPFVIAGAVLCPECALAAGLAIAAGIGFSYYLDYMGSSTAPKEAPAPSYPKIYTIRKGNTNSSPEKNPKGLPLPSPELDSNKKNEKKVIIYRALNSKDEITVAKGVGIYAKNPNGKWDLRQHLINGSNDDAWKNDPWIATTTDLNVAIRFNKEQNRGIVAIDLSKIGQMPRNGAIEFSSYSDNFLDEIAHDLAQKDKELTFYKQIPQKAIVGWIKK